jgi:predicted GNAT family N-acyltransferase
MQLVFKIIEHNTPAYWQLVDLRDKVLRKPLGLKFSPEELAAENNQYHIGAFVEDIPVACLSMLPLNIHLLKMRQVCTDTSMQCKGVGKQLAAFCEKWAVENGFTKIECHARATAVPFYKSMGYKVVSDLFYEVGIEHYKMEKVIS